MGQIEAILYLTSGMIIFVQSETPVCEYMGICLVSINETNFSCGETYENTTKDEFPPDLTPTWTCLTQGRLFDFSHGRGETAGTYDFLVYFLCINNKEVKKILVGIDWVINLKGTIERFGGSFWGLLSLCFTAGSEMSSKHRYMGNLEKYDISHTIIIAPTTELMIPTWTNSPPRAVSTQCNRVHGGLISSEMTMESATSFEFNMEEIAFDNNEISVLKKGYFNHYKHLRILSLSYNSITTIEMDSLPTASSLEIFDISYNDLGNDSLCNLKTWTSKWSNISIGVRCITNGCSIDISTYHNCPDKTEVIVPVGGQVHRQGIIVTIVQAVIGAFGGVVSVAIVTMKMIKVFQNSSRKEETNYNDVENSYKYVQTGNKCTSKSRN